MKKVLFVLAAVTMVCFMTTSALAVDISNRAELEMQLGAECDQAGSIKMSFEQSDWQTMKNIDYSNGEYLLIKLTLSATDIEIGLDEQEPVLCKAIHGSADLTNHNPGLPTNAIWLDKIGTEISDVAGSAVAPYSNGVRDFSAYVWGELRSRTIYVAVTDLEPALNVVGDPNIDWNDQGQWPWFSIGLYEELLFPLDANTASDSETTEICVDVSGFDLLLAKLTYTKDAVPTITFEVDDVIGTFSPEDQFTLTDCGKNDYCEGQKELTEIEVCLEDDESGPNAEECPPYYECFFINGPLPDGIELGELWVEAVTPGIYIENVEIQGIAENMYYYPANSDYANDVEDTILGNDGETAAVGRCTQLARFAAAYGFQWGNAGNSIKFCITYNINETQAQVAVGEQVNFRVTGLTLPCGSLFTKDSLDAKLVGCQGTDTSMYFPYVLSGSAPWATGLVISNLSSAVDAGDMEVTFTLTDSDGVEHTYAKTDFTDTEKVYVTGLDDITAMFDTAPAGGNAWLRVDGNFVMDGFCFHSDGTFGAGTLPRLMYDPVSMWE
jgi:hypothetical protein